MSVLDGIPDDDELLFGPKPLASLGAPSPGQPVIGRPAPPSNLPPVTLRGVSPATSSPDLAARRTGDEAELSRLQSTGSGIHQVTQKHPVIGRILQGLDALGTGLVPGLAAAIPGTTLHHAQLENRQRGEIGQDIGEQGKEATNQEALARTGEAQARTALTDEQTRELQNPQAKPKEEEWSVIPGMIGPDGQLVQQEKNSGQIRFAPNIAGVGPAKTSNEKPDSLDQQYNDAIQRGDHAEAARLLKVKHDLATAGQAPERPERPQQQLAVVNGKVVELKPGMDVPEGTQSLAGNLKINEPNAEERKRSEMAENVNENLDKLEEIVKRRTDLFGPLAGRLTEGKMFVGSDDQDIAALKTIKDQLGMAQQSAHSMRNAQHVAEAANSILNSFHNGPDAINSSIRTARDSLKTFTKDVQQGNPASRRSSETSKPAGKTSDNDPLGIR